MFSFPQIQTQIFESQPRMAKRKCWLRVHCVAQFHRFQVTISYKNWIAQSLYTRTLATLHLGTGHVVSERRTSVEPESPPTGYEPKNRVEFSNFELIRK